MRIKQYISFDYAPFGSEMETRTFSSIAYKYGFNGMEKDDEIQGSGNAYDFGARIYDSRLGRWMTLDPAMAKYPNLSPYNFAANSPIYFLDFDGRDIINPYDPNKEGEEGKFLKVQQAIEIVKVTMPELYNRLNNDSEIKITVQIGDESDYKEPSMDVGNETKYQDETPETHTLGTTSKSFKHRQLKVKPIVEDDQITGHKIVKSSWDFENKKSVETEVTLDEIKDDVTASKVVTISLDDGISSQRLLGKTLAHELGHAEYNNDNAAQAWVEYEARELGTSDANSSEDAAEDAENKFSKAFRKTSGEDKKKANAVAEKKAKPVKETTITK